jgi:DNA-3-methyladenine glycosylase I
MQKPPQVTPTSLADYLDMMSRAVFSAGMSWKVIEAKWEGTREAFDRFEPKTVAAYNPNDVERLMTDPRVVHNRRKIEAVIANAGELIIVDRDWGGITNYFTSFATDEELVKDLHRRFKFLGEFGARFFLFGVGFRPDAHERWAYAQAAKGAERRHHGQ